MSARASIRNYVFFVLLVSAVSATGASWNLPYSQPSIYNYSSYFSADLNTFLSGSPTLFRDEFSKGWRYYKTTFIMSNGLVNHQRLSNSTIVGQNEAVSEGQGYGMILAVLNNDQSTFNKIFEAANTYLWRSDKKSYFIWNWPSNQQGAATDADLDIGLALVFADALQKKKLWQDYSKNGITYSSRAMEIIRSIRTNMTSNDYLLPGDNWGNEAINNLNPSYFATAWLKVFNAFQTEVNFTPVIDKCYQVLAKMPQYSKGQAADWVNSNGSQSSHGGAKAYRGLGMTSDGIRTPWRIALDALWFNDQRALAYCLNSKNTLSEYTNTANPNFMIAQMAQYTDAAQAIPETKGSFDFVAMWACGVLGSKNQAFTTKAISSRVIGKIMGTSSDYFGSSSLQDEKFYYKQSLGLLGFATLTGQFPNIFQDMKNPFSTVTNAFLAKHYFAVTCHSGSGIQMRSPVPLESARIEIFSPNGEQVLSQSIASESREFFMSLRNRNLPSGTYIGLLQSSTSVWAAKFSWSR